MKPSRGIPYVVGLALMVCLKIVESKVFAKWGQVEPLTVGFVIGGSKVDARERYPWHVAIFYAGQYRGGGSIISDRHILTVTHLTYDDNRKQINPAHLIVKAGTIQLSAGDSTDYQVAEILRYPGYDETTLLNDICLFRLKSAIIFDKYIRPVKLWDTPDAVMSTVQNGKLEETVVGFGLTENQHHSDVLKFGKYNHVNLEECAKNVPIFTKALMKNYNFCAKGSNAAICKGDSAGGLVYYSSTKHVYYLRGLVSQGYWQGETCSTVKEALFTDIVHYIKWIEKNSLPSMYNLLGHPDCDGFVKNQHSKMTLPGLVNLKYAFRKSFFISDCQGVLITKKHVLTQAECVASNSVRKLHSVAVGSSAINDFSEPSQQYSVQSIETEKELAIIILAKEVADPITPVCIPTRPEDGKQSVLYWDRKSKHPKYTQYQSIIQSNNNTNRIQELLKVKIYSDTDNQRMGSTPLLYTVSDETGDHLYVRALEKCSIHGCSNGESESFVDILKYRNWIKEITKDYIDDSVEGPPLDDE